MGRFLRTILHDNVAISAGGTPLEKDLGVNPISFLLLTLRAQTLAANTLPTLANLLAALSKVEVTFQGTSVVDVSLADLYRMSMALTRVAPIRENLDDDVNAVTFLTVPIPFSRVPYWVNEGIPATKKGNLTSKLTIAAAFTNITGVQVQLEQVELLDAVPLQFLKYTTKADTPAATGEKSYDLPLGNPILGVLLFGTTVPTGTSFNASIRKVKVKVDNVETGFSAAHWESLHNAFVQRADSEWELETVKFLENLAGVYTQNVETGAPADAFRSHRQYAYLDYDPLLDGSYALETEGKGAVQVLVTSDVADAIRLMPVELIKLPGAAAPGAA